MRFFIKVSSLALFLVGFLWVMQACSSKKEQQDTKQEQSIRTTDSMPSTDGIESERIEPAKDGTKEDIKATDQTHTQESHTQEPIQALPKLRQYFPKPTVAIVIDDIVFATQIKHLKTLGIKVTPSIMPRSQINPRSHDLRQLAEFYMVHIPLEAENFIQNEHIVLKVGDSDEMIIQRVRQIKKDFPEVKFINNHTGSKFSADYKGMKTLLNSLKEEGIVFVDSKTISTSVGERIYHEWNERMLVRDVFLDYNKSIPSIKKQLAATIALAKKKGYAFAIGHPYPETLKVLSDPSLLRSGVEFVYLYELFE